MSLPKILCIEDEDEIRELIIITLETSIEAEFIEFNCGNDAIEYLKSNPEISMVLCDYQMSNGNGRDVYEYMLSHLPNIPFSFITANSLNDMMIDEETFYQKKKNNIFRKPWDEVLLINYVSVNLSHNLVGSEYIGFRPRLFFQLKSSPVDIFVKINEDKFVKIINSNDSNYISVLEKYEQKKIEKVFVRSVDSKKILDFLALSIFGELSKSSCSGVEKIKNEKMAVSLIQNIALELGIEKNTQEMINELSCSIKSKISSDTKLSDLRQMLESLGNDYETHSLLISYISTILLKRLKLESRSTIEKLCTAALLHDLFLENFDTISLHDSSTKNITEFSYANRLIIKDHMVKCCDFINQSKSILQDVDTIILQHHEKPDGSGYPKGLTGLQISPLSTIFILSEFLAIEIQNNNMLFPQKVELLKKLEQYDKGNFKNAYKELKLFINNV